MAFVVYFYHVRALFTIRFAPYYIKAQSNSKGPEFYANNLDAEEDSGISSGHDSPNSFTFGPTPMYSNQPEMGPGEHLHQQETDQTFAKKLALPLPQPAVGDTSSRPRRVLRGTHGGRVQEGADKRMTRSHTPPSLSDARKPVCHPTNASVYCANKGEFKNPMFHGEETRTPCMDSTRPAQGGEHNTSGYWSASQEQGQTGVHGFSGATGRQPPMTGAFVSDHELREGGGRRPLRYDACPGCSQSLARACVTQIPCYHMVCKQCTARYVGDPCFVCGKAVNRIVRKDTAFLE